MSKKICMSSLSAVILYVMFYTRCCLLSIASLNSRRNLSTKTSKCTSPIIICPVTMPLSRLSQRLSQ
ncbi:hypothetical protein C2G38_2095470 [Gigaspora rosea]|uniref:Uncharacterized protein n=1 Tax=Gigaspora rosea TaxID=44941 RepID=A0A397UWE1_9GLOM|nr:hypothetical protein C2G38_2095470 [Gigaspora rosea]